MTASLITDHMKKTIEEKASLLVDKPFDLSQIKAFMKEALEGVIN
jgi:hypothetical protein